MQGLADGWVPGKTLFSLEEAAERGTKIQYLGLRRRAGGYVGRDQALPKKATRFTSLTGSGIVYREQTGIVAPDSSTSSWSPHKGSGTACAPTSFRAAGINSSLRFNQDATGRATERAIAAGIAIGSGYLFPTTFEKKSTLTARRARYSEWARSRG